MAYKAKPLSFLSYEECHVSYCEHGPWKFCLQFKQQRDVYIHLQQRLKLYYLTGNLVRSSLSPGSSVLCCILNNSDIECYRGLVNGGVYEDEVSVYFVDKGTIQKLSTNCLWALPLELLDTPVLIYRCSLDGLPSIEDPRITNRFLEIVNTHPLMGKIVRHDEKVSVSMLASGVDILPMIMPSYKETVLTTNSRVVVSFISDEILYVQHCESKLDVLQARLQIEAESMPVMSHPRFNQACAAKFQDDCWYRGLVLEPGNTVKVRYVDYGNIGYVAPSDVRVLSMELLSEFPSQAIPCTLHQVSSQHLKKEYILQTLETSADKVLIVKVTAQIEKTIDKIKCKVYEIQALTSDFGLSLNTTLNQMIFRDISRNQPRSHRSLDAKPRKSYGDYNRTDRALGVSSGEQAMKTLSTITEIVPGPMEEVVRRDVANIKLPVVEIKPKQHLNVCLTWVDKSCFYVTLLENEGLLQNLKKNMQEGCRASVKRGHEVISGWLVAVESDDHLWCRACVTHCHGQLIELFIVDSGKDMVVKRDTLRTLPESVLTIPAQAIKCTLTDSTLTPHMLKSMKKEIGNSFLVCFERLINGIWEVQMYKKFQHSPGVETSEPDHKCAHEATTESSLKDLDKPSKTKEKRGHIGSLLENLGKRNQNDYTCKDEDAPPIQRSSVHAQEELSTGTGTNNQSLDTLGFQSLTGPVRNKMFRYHSSHIGSDHQSWKTNRYEEMSYKQNPRYVEKNEERLPRASFQSSVSEDENNVQRKSEGYFRDNPPPRFRNQFNKRIQSRDETDHSSNVSNSFTTDYTQDMKPEKDKYVPPHKRTWGPSGKRSPGDKMESPFRKNEESFRDSPKKKPEDLFVSPDKKLEKDSWNSNTEKKHDSEREGTGSVFQWKGRKSESKFISSSKVKPVNEMLLNSKSEKSFPAAEAGCASDVSVSKGTCFKSAQHLVYLKISLNIPIDVYIVSFVSPIRFWCHLADNDEAFQNMSKEIQQEYNKNFIPVSQPLTVGQLVMAQYSVDNMWYRAIVRNVADSRIMVEFYDYGNSEEVEISTLQAIKEEFIDRCPVQMFCVMLANLETSNVKDTLVQEELNVNTQVILSSQSEENVYIASNVQANGKNYVKFLFDEGIATPKSIPQPSVNCREIFSAVISHVEDGSLWLRALKHSTELDELMQQINEISSRSLESLQPSPQTGSYCLSRFNDDGRYYRVVVKELNTDAGVAVVLYIDYGNTDTVKVHSLWALPDNFFALPSQAILCHFSDEIKKLYSQEAQIVFENLLEQEVSVSLTEKCANNTESNDFVLEVCKHDNIDILSQISMKDLSKLVAEECEGTKLPGKDITNEAFIVDSKKVTFSEPGINEDLKTGEELSIIHAKTYFKPCFPYNGEFTAFVSHVSTDGAVWIQAANQASNLEEMMKKLNEISEILAIIDAPALDSPCLCRYSEDGKYYRAIVREVNVEQRVAKVNYIDYGNDETVSFDELFVVPAAFLELPCQAQVCYFPTDIQNHWSQAAQRQIIELLEQEVIISLGQENKKTVLNVCKLNGMDIMQGIQEVATDSSGLHESEDTCVRSEELSNTSELPPREDVTEDIVLCYESPSTPDCLHINIPELLVKYNEEFYAFVSHIESDGSFWIQPCDNSEVLENMMSKLNSDSETLLEKINSPVVDFPCLSRYSQDGRLYRAVMKTLDEDLTHAVVLYADYGNNERVEICDLYELPESFCGFPFQALHCYFSEETGDHLSQSNQKQIDELLEEEICISLHLGYENNLVVNTCTVNGVDILARRIADVSSAKFFEGNEVDEVVLNVTIHDRDQPHLSEQEIIDMNKEEEISERGDDQTYALADPSYASDNENNKLEQNVTSFDAAETQGPLEQDCLQTGKDELAQKVTEYDVAVAAKLFEQEIDELNKAEENISDRVDGQIYALADTHVSGTEKNNLEQHYETVKDARDKHGLGVGDHCFIIGKDEIGQNMTECVKEAKPELFVQEIDELQKEEEEISNRDGHICSNLDDLEYDDTGNKWERHNVTACNAGDEQELLIEDLCIVEDQVDEQIVTECEEGTKQELLEQELVDQNKEEISDGDGQIYVLADSAYDNDVEEKELQQHTVTVYDAGDRKGLFDKDLFITGKDEIEQNVTEYEEAAKQELFEQEIDELQKEEEEISDRDDGHICNLDDLAYDDGNKWEKHNEIACNAGDEQGLLIEDLCIAEDDLVDEQKVTECDVGTKEFLEEELVDQNREEISDGDGQIYALADPAYVNDVEEKELQQHNVAVYDAGDRKGLFDQDLFIAGKDEIEQNVTECEAAAKQEIDELPKEEDEISDRVEGQINDMDDAAYDDIATNKLELHIVTSYHSGDEQELLIEDLCIVEDQVDEQIVTECEAAAKQEIDELPKEEEEISDRVEGQINDMDDAAYDDIATNKLELHIVTAYHSGDEQELLMQDLSIADDQVYEQNVTECDVAKQELFELEFVDLNKVEIPDRDDDHLHALSDPANDADVIENKLESVHVIVCDTRHRQGLCEEDHRFIIRKDEEIELTVTEYGEPVEPKLSEQDIDELHREEEEIFYCADDQIYSLDNPAYNNNIVEKLEQHSFSACDTGNKQELLEQDLFTADDDQVDEDKVFECNVGAKELFAEEVDDLNKEEIFTRDDQIYPPALYYSDSDRNTLEQHNVDNYDFGDEEVLEQEFHFISGKDEQNVSEKGIASPLIPIEYFGNDGSFNTSLSTGQKIGACEIVNSESKLDRKLTEKESETELEIHRNSLTALEHSTYDENNGSFDATCVAECVSKIEEVKNLAILYRNMKDTESSVDLHPSEDFINLEEFLEVEEHYFNSETVEPVEDQGSETLNHLSPTSVHYEKALDCEKYEIEISSDLAVEIETENLCDLSGTELTSSVEGEHFGFDSSKPFEQKHESNSLAPKVVDVAIEITQIREHICYEEADESSLEQENTDMDAKIALEDESRSHSEVLSVPGQLQKSDIQTDFSYECGLERASSVPLGVSFEGLTDDTHDDLTVESQLEGNAEFGFIEESEDTKFVESETSIYTCEFAHLDQNVISDINRLAELLTDDIEPEPFRPGYFRDQNTVLNPDHECDYPEAPDHSPSVECLAKRLRSVLLDVERHLICQDITNDTSESEDSLDSTDVDIIKQLVDQLNSEQEAFNKSRESRVYNHSEQFIKHENPDEMGSDYEVETGDNDQNVAEMCPELLEQTKETIMYDEIDESLNWEKPPQPMNLDQFLSTTAQDQTEQSIKSESTNVLKHTSYPFKCKQFGEIVYDDMEQQASKAFGEQNCVDDVIVQIDQQHYCHTEKLIELDQTEHARGCGETGNILKIQKCAGQLTDTYQTDNFSCCSLGLESKEVHEQNPIPLSWTNEYLDEALHILGSCNEKVLTCDQTKKIDGSLLVKPGLDQAGELTLEDWPELPKNLHPTTKAPGKPCQIVADKQQESDKCEKNTHDDFEQSEITHSQLEFRAKPTFNQQSLLVNESVVHVSHMELFEHVWLQQNDDEEDLEKLWNFLQDFVDILPEPEVILEGMACIAQKSVDHCWYRAKITGIKDEKIGAYFVDFGYFESVHVRQIREISDYWLRAPYSYYCRVLELGDDSRVFLSSVGTSYRKEPLVLTLLNEEEAKQILTLHRGKQLIGTLLFDANISWKPVLAKKENDCNVPLENVETLQPHRDVVKKTVHILHSIQELAENENTSVTQYYRALLIHVDDHPFSLWVQKEEDAGFAEFINTFLDKNGPKFEVVEHPEKGQLCLSVFKGSKQRVKLISFDDAIAQVHYIDLGKYGIVSRQELWVLENELIDIHPLASQIFLPVKIEKGMESRSVVAVGELALNAMCFCIELRLKSPEKKIKTLVMAEGVGDLGKYLDSKKLARLINLDSEVMHQVSYLLNHHCTVAFKDQ